MEIEIIPMEEKHLERIMEIEALCFHEPYRRDHLLYELHENEYCLSYSVLLHNLVIGFALVYLLFDQASIVQIAIDPQFQNQGIGSELMKDIERDCIAKKARIITLEVREKNMNAHRFYLKHGFRDVTMKENYYPNGDNAIYMIKEIER